MFHFLEKIHFAGLVHIRLAIILITAVFVTLIIHYVKARRGLAKLSSKKFQHMFISGASMSRRLLKITLLFISFFFLMLAILRPQWNKREEPIEQEGRDILIAVDISRSMLARDVEPNRLEFVKAKIKKIISNLSCERVGLIIFSGKAVLQCPLTTDYAAFFMFLDGLSVEMISSGTTNIEEALLKALEVFKSMETRQTKLLCIFTDGEDFSTDLQKTTSNLHEHGLVALTMGVGTLLGAPVPIVDIDGNYVGFEQDSSGSVIMSRLNEDLLRELANKTGGSYIATSKNDQDVQKLIQVVETFEKNTFGELSVIKFQEQYPYFVAVSFLCYLLEWLL